jgi:hypothetical protein
MRTVLLMAFVALAATVSPLTAEAYTEGRTQGIPLFSLRDDSLGFAAGGEWVVLRKVSADAAGRWDVIPVPTNIGQTAVYRNVATGTCLAAQSPIDGLALKLVPCDAQAPRQQWELQWNHLWRNVGTRRCVRAEGIEVGARLYQEVCDQSDKTTEFSDLFRVKLAIVSGDGQELRSGQTGAPLVVRITDEEGRPLAGAKLVFELRGPWVGDGGYDVSPAGFGSQGGSRVSVTADAQGVATTPALTGLRDRKGSFAAEVDPFLTRNSDLHALQDVTFQGTVR